MMEWLGYWLAAVCAVLLGMTLAACKQLHQNYSDLLDTHNRVMKEDCEHMGKLILERNKALEKLHLVNQALAGQQDDLK